MIWLELFLGFLWVGSFTFGGAYAAIPLIWDVVMKNGWLTEDSLTYMIAVSESTPGPIMVNLATYIGSSQGGLPGALVATLAVVLPSFCIILLILAVLKNLIRHPVVQSLLGGMQPCAVGIILATGIYMTMESTIPSGIMDFRAAVIFVVLGGLILLGRRKQKNLSPILLIMLSAVMGAVLYGI